LKTTTRLRKAAALAGLTIAASGALAGLAPTAASAAAAATPICASWTQGKAGFVQCSYYGKQFRAVVQCEHLVSGRYLVVYGDYVNSPTNGTGVSIGECGSDYRVNQIAWQFK
jgi:hypothetical protein